MKLLILILSILSICSAAYADDLQLLNHDCFDRPVSSAVELFLDNKANEIAPYMITVDIKFGKYAAASVFYENDTFEDALQSLSKLYKGETISFHKESKYATWHIEDKHYSVNLVKEAWGVMVIYIPLQEIDKGFQEMLNEMRNKIYNDEKSKPNK